LVNTGYFKILTDNRLEENRY